MRGVRSTQRATGPSTVASHAPTLHPALAMQQLIGNAATGALWSLQRDPDPDAPEPAELTLGNPRFVGDRSLARILSGDTDQLSARHNGRARAVSKVQRALVDLGFDLPLHRVDGQFGAETTTAISEFRSRYGPTPGDILDGATLAVLDRVTPTSTDTQVEHTVDYGQLLADNRLDVTVGFGFTDYNAVSVDAEGTPEVTETPVEQIAAERFREWMTSRGFALELLGFDGGVEHWKAEHNFVWYDDEGGAHSHTADVWVQLIVPGAGAAAAFGSGITNDEITLYSGHARYGSGPDFVEKDSSAENFRIGIDAAMQAAGRRTRVAEARSHHVAVDEVNDLVELTSDPDFDRDRYRVLFLQACTSMAYLDELRSEVGGGAQLDVVGSRVPTAFTRVANNVNANEMQIFLGGILDGETVEDIVRALDENQQSMYNNAHSRGVFTMSGVGDNPISQR